MGRSSGHLNFHHMMKNSREKMGQISSKDVDVFCQFITLLRNLLAGRIDARGVRAIVQGLCRGDTDLMLKLYNFPPKQYQTILPFQLSEMTGVKRKKVNKVEENCELPCDVLENISKTLDFDDLFHFSGVCKNWRAFHKIYVTNFLAYHEPLLLQILFDDEQKESFSLISISNQKVYCLKMMDYIVKSHYLAFFGGYFVKVASFNNKFLLINPFTRTKKVIDVFTFKVYPGTYANHALLAFSKCSEEFVLVVLCLISDTLRVYQSRNCDWVTYSSTMENKERVVHFVVLHNIIYIVTNKANIGVLSLNSPNIKFLKLKNTPDATDINFRLVSCNFN
ncbi:uncharacterized protein LOC123907216 isoform X2 [Trifolium pratense]|uniref:Uncharacterized protein n=1 Tax=Trifolium pratense TaxID=57577 RepID=A0ACB0K312_TRIPR|nr:uncharacterized protein LOC123907216 isoform X2 [Trifolium pratense]CAJ2650133.1 unnamed protein product [Trifolium pratense]